MLFEIFGHKSNFKIPFPSRIIILVAELYQLTPVLQRSVYAEFYTELYNINHLWIPLLIICGLIEAMRQRSKTILIETLNSTRLGNTTPHD